MLSTSETILPVSTSEAFLLLEFPSEVIALLKSFSEALFLLAPPSEGTTLYVVFCRFSPPSASLLDVGKTLMLLSWMVGPPPVAAPGITIDFWAMSYLVGSRTLWEKEDRISNSTCSLTYEGTILQIYCIGWDWGSRAEVILTRK